MRILIAQIFLLSGIGGIGNFAHTAAGMAAKGLPLVELLLIITILIKLGAALMIPLGW